MRRQPLSLLLFLCTAIPAFAQWERIAGPYVDTTAQINNINSIQVWNDSLVLLSNNFSGIHINDASFQDPWKENNKGLSKLTVFHTRILHDTLYALTESGLYKKNIPGDTSLPWIDQGNSFFANTRIIDAAGSDSFLIAATSNTGLFRNKYGSGTWMAVNNGLFDNNIISVIHDNDSFFVLTAAAGVFYSADQAASWQQYAGLTNSANFLYKQGALLVLAGDTSTTVYFKNTVLASLSLRIRGVLKSDFIYFFDSTRLFATNDFLHIDTLPPLPDPASKIRDIAMKDSLLLVTDRGLYRKNSNGWEKFSRDLDIAPVEQMVANDSFLFAKIYGTVYRFDGNNFTSCYHQEPGLNKVSHLTSDGSRIIATSSSTGVFTSDNNGISWQQKFTLTTIFHGLKVMDNRYYLFCDSGVFLSSDKGANWNLFLPMPGARPNRVHDIFFKGDTIILATGRGTFVTYNNGVNYEALDNSLPMKETYFFFRNRNELWAQVQQVLFITNDLNNFTSWYGYFYENFPNLPKGATHSFIPGGEITHTLKGILYRRENENSWNFQRELPQQRIAYVFTVFKDDLYAASSYGIFRMKKDRLSLFTGRISQSELRPFPNPVAKNTDLFLPGLKENTLIEMYDTQGKCVMRKHINKESIHVGDLPPGIYFLRDAGDPMRVPVKIFIY